MQHHYVVVWVCVSYSFLFLACQAVNVGDVEGISSFECPNVTTVSLSNQSLIPNSVQLTIASTCTSHVVNVTTNSEGIQILNLRRRGIEDIRALPSVNTVRLEHNEIRTFTTTNNIANLDVSYARLDTLENMSFPSTITTLTFSSNPIHLIRGVTFPTSLTHFTLTSATTNALETSSHVITSAREVQAPSTTIRASVLQEFEVRQTDADTFTTLRAWNVSPTWTLNCSDARANPRYIHDTMLCVLSDRAFALKYQHVLARGTRPTSPSLHPIDEQKTLHETLDQRRSWFLLSATAILSAWTFVLFITGLGRWVRRSYRTTSEKAASKSTRAPNHTGPEAACTRLQHALPQAQVDSSCLPWRTWVSIDEHTVQERFSPFRYFHATLYHETVVLKTLRPARENHKTLDRFCHEIRLCATLSHPHIVQFRGFVMDEITSIALIMENMHKGELHTLLQEHKRQLPHDDVHTSAWSWRTSSDVYKSKLDIAIDVTQALHYLHSLSLVHGNLSSRKIYIDHKWNIKLGDFTCCSAWHRLACSSSSVDEIPIDMTVWTAPEVVDGLQYTPRADIYSLGVLLLELATYDVRTVSEHCVLDDVPILTPPRDDQLEVPTAIRLIVLRCQAPDPDARPTPDTVLTHLCELKERVAL
ncbi:hypothetical protein PsorP6_012901 [Peronosclerospora sorghi]|uniref:Uncharacterized protein n=1 Tax=Peronosclerospora sorghi TaxID=230839 RepID=A0ACC0WGA2_9STRA|nr:hypothetical protein PsorP6_012901 [Peronosclerospora sorghi]